MAQAGDLMIRVKFAGTDGLSKMLDRIEGSSKRAGAALTETNRTLGKQRAELKDVQRELSKAGGNITGLIDRERVLEESVAKTTRQFERQTKIVGINARTARAGRAGHEMVANGQAGLFSAAAPAAVLFAVARAGAQFEALQSRMRVLGLGKGAVDELTAFANAMNVAGSSVTDNMRYLLEAQGVFRESGEHSVAEQLSGAKMIAPLIAKMHVVAQATGKELSEDQERYFLRFIEQAGGLSNSKRAAELTDGLFRALQSSGGNVQASDYQGFLAHAGIAGSHMTDRSKFADFEPLIGELHEGAGTGLATAFKMASGIKVNSRAADEFIKLGLWDRNKVTFNKMGGVKTTKGNPLQSRAADLLQHDPVEFYRQIVMPAYAKGGIKTSEGRSFETAKLFGGTGGNLFNLIDKQLPTILRSRVAYQKTESLDKAYTQTNDNFFGQEGKLRAAGKDFMVAAGTKGGLLDNVAALMNNATTALKAFTAFGNAHPTAFAWIGKIATYLLEAKVGVSVLKIAFGGLLGPVAKVAGIWGKVRAAGSVAEAFPAIGKAGGLARRGAGLARKGVGLLSGRAGKIARGARGALGLVADGTVKGAVAGFGKLRAASGRMTGAFLKGAVGGFRLVRSITMMAAGGIAQGAVTAFGAIRTAALFLGKGMMRAGAMMLANPMVLAIVAIGVAIGIVGYLVYKNWDKIKAAFSAGWHWLQSFIPMFKHIGSMMLDGLLSMLDPSRLAKHMWNLGKTAVSAFKGVLGIHSPSRVFAELGGNLTSGLAIGIDRGAGHALGRTRALAGHLVSAMAVSAAVPVGIPQMARAMAASASVRVGAPGMMHPGRGAGDARGGGASHAVTIAPGAIVIHQAPGQDAAALARAVRAELERLMRHEDARRRSSFRDEPDRGGFV